MTESKPKFKIKFRDPVVQPSTTEDNVPSKTRKTRQRSKDDETHEPIFSKRKRDIFCIKTSLKSIVINDNVHQQINEIVKQSHLLTTRAYQFIRLYLLKRYHAINQQLSSKIISEPPSTMFPINPRKQQEWDAILLNTPEPDIKDRPQTFDDEIFRYFIRTCGTSSGRGHKANFKELESDLYNFYHEEFEPCLFHKEMYDRQNMNHLINSMATQMNVCFTTNIKNHFITRIRHLMNILKPDPDLDKKIFGKMKNQILMNKAHEIDSKYVNWVAQVRSCLPNLKEGTYGYDCKVYPEKYLYYQIKISEIIEDYNQTHEQQHKLYQPIPMRTSWIPNYTTLTTMRWQKYF